MVLHGLVEDTLLGSVPVMWLGSPRVRRGLKTPARSTVRDRNRWPRLGHPQSGGRKNRPTSPRLRRVSALAYFRASAPRKYDVHSGHQNGGGCGNNSGDDLEGW